MSRKSTLWSLIAALMILTMVISACAPAATPTQPPATEAPQATEAMTEEPQATEAMTEEPEATEAMTEEPEATEAATEEPAPTEEPPAAVEMPPLVGPEGGFLEQAMNGDFNGTVVRVDGPFTSPDTEKFEESVRAFEEATGIDVVYIGDKQFESRISIAVDAGTAPDIADFPQPGGVLRFIEQGKVIDPTTFISQEWLTQQYNQSWLDMGIIAGQTGGVWHRFNGKSLVWYPKDDFDAAGYAIPTTWDEMLELTEQIKADGDAPWCVGIESQAAGELRRVGGRYAAVQLTRGDGCSREAGRIVAHRRQCLRRP